MDQRLVIAFPGYINTLPLLHYFRVRDNFLLLKDTPKRINEGLSLGLLDIGLASSLYYARNHRRLLILPDISISATGKVKSVILYHREPLSELSCKKIGITPETETSFGLLRIVFEEFLQIHPEYVPLTERFSELSETDQEELSGYLAIGDEALLLETKQVFDYSTDLAEFWLNQTGLPFVFALLVVRKEVVEQKRAQIEGFLKEIFLSRARGLSHLSDLADISAGSLSRDQIFVYLQHLEYDFSGLKQRAFQCFCELLYKRSLIPEMPKLNFFPL